MGIYYNPYFTIEIPAPWGRLIFLIIILLRHNIALGNIILKKRPLSGSKRPFKRLKGSFFRRNIPAA